MCGTKIRLAHSILDPSMHATFPTKLKALRREGTEKSDALMHTGIRSVHGSSQVDSLEPIPRIVVRFVAGHGRVELRTLWGLIHASRSVESSVRLLYPQKESPDLVDNPLSSRFSAFIPVP